MAVVGGKFQLMKNENFYEHLLKLGVPKEKCKLLDALRPVTEIVIDEKTLTITSKGQNFNSKSTLVLDEEIEENLSLDLVVKSLAILDDNKIRIVSTAPTGQSGIREFEFLGEEMIMSLSSDNKDIPKAKRYYSRIKNVN